MIVSISINKLMDACGLSRIVEFIFAFTCSFTQIMQRSHDFPIVRTVGEVNVWRRRGRSTRRTVYTRRGREKGGRERERERGRERERDIYIYIEIRKDRGREEGGIQRRANTEEHIAMLARDPRMRIDTNTHVHVFSLPRTTYML